MNQQFTAKPVNWAQSNAELKRIRTLVFMHEQQVPETDEWDGRDEDATHFLILETGVPIGCARILAEQYDGKDVFHIGRVAILKDWRGQGAGQELMRNILIWCHQHGPEQSVYLHAQTAKQGFYAALGFVTSGDEFMDAGIPHICMWLAN